MRQLGLIHINDETITKLAYAAASNPPSVAVKHNDDSE